MPAWLREVYEVGPVKRIAVVQGKVRRDKFFFPCRVNHRLISNVVLDTGASDFIISERMAAELKLPHDKSVFVRGVSGTTRAWTSRCNLTLGKHRISNVPCVIVRGLPYQALFGLRFFVDHGYKLLLDPANGTLSVLR